MKLTDLVSKIGFDVDAKPLDTVSQRLDAIKQRLDFLGTAQVLRGIFSLTQSMSGFATDLLNAATTAGVTTEQLQGLQYAATQAGASSQDMSGALSTLTKALYEARQGNEQAAESFRSVGFSPAQVAGFRTSSDALAALSDRIAGMTDPIQRQAIATKLLGGSANNLIPLLAKGSKGIATATAEAQKMGAILGGKNLQALRETEEALGGLWQMVKVVSATIASYFGPSITAAVKDLMSWYQAHQKLIQTKIKEWVENTMYDFGFVSGVVQGLTERYLRWAEAHPMLAHAMEYVAAAIGGVSVAVLALSPLVRILTGLFGVLSTAIAPVGAIAKGAFAGLIALAGAAVKGIVAVLFHMAVLTETAFPALSAALLSFAGVLEATPIGWIITAVAALVLGLQAAYVMLFRGGAFKDTWLGQMWEGLKGAGSWVLDKLGLTSADTDKRANVPYREGLAKDDTNKKGVPNQLARDLPQTSFDDMGNLVQPLPPTQELGGLAALAGDPSRAMMPSEQTVNVSAPVTINVPAGTPPAAVADAVKDGVKEHFDRVSRETRRSLRPSQAY